MSLEHGVGPLQAGPSSTRKSFRRRRRNDEYTSITDAIAIEEVQRVAAMVKLRASLDQPLDMVNSDSDEEEEDDVPSAVIRRRTLSGIPLVRQGSEKRRETRKRLEEEGLQTEEENVDEEDDEEEDESEAEFETRRLTGNKEHGRTFQLGVEVEDASDEENNASSEGDLSFQMDMSRPSSRREGYLDEEDYAQNSGREHANTPNSDFKRARYSFIQQQNTMLKGFEEDVGGPTAVSPSRQFFSLDEGQASDSLNARKTSEGASGSQGKGFSFTAPRIEVHKASESPAKE